MRTFIAIDLPAAVKQEMRALQRRLQNDLRPIGGDRLFKWTNPDKVHVTLRFLGETSDTQVDQIHADLRRITADAIPFALNLDGIGVFPNWPRVRVLWAGVSGELAALHRLQQAVETAAQAAGFVAEDKSFSPTSPWPGPATTPAANKSGVPVNSYAPGLRSRGLAAAQSGASTKSSTCRVNFGPRALSTPRWHITRLDTNSGELTGSGD
ncbi:MAG: RNA 2',3'-cyclic phosphodiesterase [Caldilineaceae bacterium]